LQPTKPEDKKALDTKQLPLLKLRQRRLRQNTVTFSATSPALPVPQSLFLFLENAKKVNDLLLS